VPFRPDSSRSAVREVSGVSALQGFGRFGRRAETIFRAECEQTVTISTKRKRGPAGRPRSENTLPDPLHEPILPGHAGKIAPVSRRYIVQRD